MRYLKALALGVVFASAAAAQKTPRAVVLPVAWFETIQGEDGHCVEDQEEQPSRKRPKAPLRTTALIALAWAADTNTLERGPWRGQLTLATNWLLAQVDKRGRIGFRADRHWIVDHALATYGLVEIFRLSKIDRPKSLTLAVSHLASHLERPKIRATHETIYWSDRLAQALKASDANTKYVRKAVASHRKRILITPAKTDLDKAIRFAFQVADSHLAKARPTAAEPNDVEAARWRDKMEVDPLTILVLTSSFYTVGGRPWKTWCKGLTQRLLRTQRPDGTWLPGEGPAGLVHTTALHGCALTMYYRYCGLVPF